MMSASTRTMGSMLTHKEDVLHIFGVLGREQLKFMIVPMDSTLILRKVIVFSRDSTINGNAYHQYLLMTARIRTKDFTKEAIAALTTIVSMGISQSTSAPMIKSLMVINVSHQHSTIVLSTMKDHVLENLMVTTRTKRAAVVRISFAHEDTKPHISAMKDIHSMEKDVLHLTKGQHVDTTTRAMGNRMATTLMFMTIVDATSLATVERKSID